MREIADGIEGKIQSLFASDQYADYLRTAAKFHGYSLNNTILIYAQCPVREQAEWRDTASGNN